MTTTSTTTWCTGPALDLDEDDPRDVVSALLRAARLHPEAGVVAVGADGLGGLITYPRLLDRARRLLTGLRSRGVRRGDHVLLSGLQLADFFPAVWACVLGGAIPAVVADPAQDGGPVLERLRHTWELLDEPLVVADTPVDGFPTATVAECERYEPAQDLVRAGDDDVVVLMLSSGSTGAPKASQLTQRALVRFAASSRRILGVRPGDVSLNWLPLDHSGAFLLYHLLAVFTGTVNVHAPTRFVLAEPTRWLDLIAEHRANHSWAPTFAWQLVADTVGSRQWDLSCVRTLVCGGEQVLLPVLERFSDVTGIGRECLMPVWGMAETTTAITYGRLTDPGTVHRVLTNSLGEELVPAGDEVPDFDVTTFVAVGPPAHDTSLRIVGDDGVPLPENHIGRVHISSVRVTPGYLNAPEATEAAFPEPGWLDTGDLGFLAGGQLVITGRHKDLVVLNGHNHFSHEIEEAAASVAGVRIGGVAACGVPDERTGTERLVIFFVSTDDDAETSAAIRKALHQRLRLTAAHLVPVAEPDFPRTPAGKVQRALLRERLLSPRPADERTTAGVVADAVTAVLGGPVAEHTPFYEAGMTSVQMIQLGARIERELGTTTPVTTLFEHPTVAALATHLSGGAPSPGESASPGATPPDDRIAIIGMALRFPGANSPGEFWANLRSGVDGLTTFPGDGSARVPVMGVIDEPEAFDAEFFGMTPQEAGLTDPAQRLFLEVCQHALEDAGHAGTSARVGVFAGSGANLYGHQGRAGIGDGSPAGMQGVIGQSPDFLVTRAAYRLGLTGPAITVQTACSTALVAVHLAAQALLTGEADLALAGAAAVHLPQESGYLPEPPLSPSGRCRPFDVEADGTVGGNGVAAVVLKRLDRAIADGDEIHAVVLGSAVNNDGAVKAGFAAPGLAGQVDVVRRALRRAAAEPDSVSYVEAHGTGTELGDPIELEALSRAYSGADDRRRPIALGSVKGNIGHLDSCAGMAGLIKVVLMLRHQELVPTLGARRPLARITESGSRFDLNTETRPWTAEGPLRAGVSALGVGGTNVHVILENAPARPAAPEPRIPMIAPLSAHDPAALTDLVGRVRGRLAADLRPLDVATTLAHGRAQLAHRAVLVGRNLEELVRPVRTEPLGRLVFAFPGQGSARFGMARELHEAFPVFREVLAQAGDDIRDLLLGADSDTPWPTETAQPALLVFEVALARLWQSFGITPDVVTGHSLGEYGALCVAGALTLTDGLRVTAARGRAMASAAPGAMLSVRAEGGLVRRIASLTGTEVAAVNGPAAHVLAGAPDQVRMAEEAFDAERVAHRRLAVDRAFHTASMADAVRRFLAEIDDVVFRPLRVPLISTLDGREHPIGWVPDIGHLARQARQPVRFDRAVTSAGDADLLEIGPGETLVPLCERGIASLGPGEGAVDALWKALGTMYVRGAEVDWNAVLPPGGRRVSLPGYPFRRTVFPVTAPNPPRQESADSFDAVQAVVARVLGVPGSSVTPDKSFLDLGADSLSLMGLARAVDSQFGVSLPVRDLFSDVDTSRKLAALVTPAHRDTAVPSAEPVRPAGVPEVVRRQLELGEKLVELMERQLDLLTGEESAAPVAVVREEPAREPVQVAPPVSVPATLSTARCDFSLYFFGDYPEQDENEKYALVNAATEFADQHDFHAVWLPERHFHSFGALFPNPSVLAASLAARTRRIRLHAGSVVLPLHDPIRVAEEWAVVDNLSGGRVGLCVASGWHAGDFALAPQNFGDHRELMYERLSEVKRLWAGDAVERTSGSGQQIEVRTSPRPIQPLPPLYVAVVGNPDSYRRAGAEGLGVVTNLITQTVEELTANIALYRRVRAEHGFDADSGRVVVLVHTYLGPDAARARAEARGPFLSYLRSSLSLFDQVTTSLGVEVDLENTPEADLEFLLDRAYERYCDSRALIGDEHTASAVVDRLVAAGANEVACFVDFGVPTARVLEALPAVDRMRLRHRSPRLAPTPAQRRIWLAERMLPGSNLYHEPKAVRLLGELDVPLFTTALRQAVNRHPALRTVFREDADGPYRVVLPSVDLDCPVLDCAGVSEDQALRAVLETDGKQHLDLTEGPLVLARLLRFDDRRHVLFLLAHHIVFDSSSTAVLLRDVAAYYGGEPPAAAAVHVPREPDPDSKQADLEHWLRELRDLPVLRLPTDRPRPPVREGVGAHVVHEFGAVLADRLTTLCAENRVTTFMALLGAVGAVLGRFSGQDDLVIGTAVSHRPEDAEDQVGLFLDTVALRMDLSGDPVFAHLLRQVRDRTVTAYEHRAVAFDEIVEALNPDRDPSRTPIFQVLVEFEHEEEVVFTPTLSARLLDVPSDRAPFDLTLYLTRHHDGLRCSVEYDSRLFDEDTVRRVLGHVDGLLRRAVEQPEARLSELTSTTGTDLEVVRSWQGKSVPVPDLGLHHLVERQVLATPDAVALLAEGTRWSYADLDGRANLVARRLRERGVGPGDFVALSLPRGPVLLAALLGVLKSGAAYVPIDPATPEARQRFLLDDCAAAEVLTSDHPVLADGPPAGPPAVEFTSDSAAYCIYTSGSTGRPKGVVVPHRGPVNLVSWHLRHHRPMRTAQWTSTAFDVSVQEIFTTLASGATLVLVNEHERHDLAAVVTRHGVERLFLPFTPLKHLVEQAPEMPSLREVFSAGEALHLTPALRRFLASHPSCALHNQYGPTEASIIVTSHRVDPEAGHRPPIGAPIDGAEVRLLDARGREVPIGTSGEIEISGLPVAHGYVGSPEFGGVYRTGDVGRWRNDGTIEYLGRLDDQVKIRGHRVEPGEVQSVLAELPGVVDAAVVARPGPHGDLELVAYVVSPRDDLLEQLARSLPDHLVPKRWVRLDRLPYNTNGKLDNERLPEHVVQPVQADRPATELEHALHRLWCAELGLDSAPVTATFFALGGHSLSAVRLINRMAADHDIALTMADFFRAPTIRAIAGRRAAEVVDTVEAPSALRRLRQRHDARRDPSVYNIAQRVDVHGRLDTDALHRALTELVRRHDALRIRLADRDDDLVVEVLREVAVDLPIIPCEDVDEWCAREAARPFALDRAPLFRFRLARVHDEHWVLLAVWHHAVCDAWSLSVLWREIGQLYRGVRLDPPAARYVDYARWERTVPHADHERFWREALDGAPLRLELPADRPRSAPLSGAGAHHELVVDFPARELAARLETTPYVVLAVAFSEWVSEVTGLPDHVLAASSANRLLAGHENTVGLFGDAVLLRTGSAGDLAERVERMSRAVSEAVDHQVLPLSEVVRLIDPGVADGLFPSVLFTVVTAPEPVVDLPGAVLRPVLRPGLARTELYVVVLFEETGVRVVFEYSTDLFDRDTVVGWGEKFTAVLERLAARRVRTSR
ncbi:MupA/Atu3671 family FMN-dependent luciferase-like monooxygenase [Lentzea sp. NPDC058450]|uniref:MupA/Atu3671 family FMN-dependent luciferase-like monooxygenase n=1 Tax=Lentzea sp. NPDC058450 TaxID=3346505 RepID=UPI00364CF49D